MFSIPEGKSADEMGGGEIREEKALPASSCLGTCLRQDMMCGAVATSLTPRGEDQETQREMAPRAAEPA